MVLEGGWMRTSGGGEGDIYDDTNDGRDSIRRHIMKARVRMNIVMLLFHITEA